MSQFHVDGYRWASLGAGPNDFIKSALNAALLPAIRRVRGSSRDRQAGKAGRAWLETEAPIWLLSSFEKCERRSQSREEATDGHDDRDAR